MGLPAVPPRAVLYTALAIFSSQPASLVPLLGCTHTSSRLGPNRCPQGNPEAPRCGFSRKVVEALQAAGEEFGSFDILGDEAVRQGLKEFSNWPTYPQAGAVRERQCSVYHISVCLRPRSTTGVCCPGPGLAPCLRDHAARHTHVLCASIPPPATDAPRGSVRALCEQHSSPLTSCAQVYVNGELLGGCDIVLEMDEAGELKDTIDEMKARM